MLTEKRNSAVKEINKRQQRWHSHRKQQPEEGSLPIPPLGISVIQRPPTEPPKGNDTPSSGLSPRSPISPRSPRSAAEKRALMKKAVEVRL